MIREAFTSYFSYLSHIGHELNKFLDNFRVISIESMPINIKQWYQKEKFADVLAKKNGTIDAAAIMR